MPTSKSRKRKPPKRVLALPDLEHAKTAVLNSLSSASGQRTYEHAIREFVAWYCSAPRADFCGFETRRSARALAGRPLQPSPTRADSRAETLE